LFFALLPPHPPIPPPTQPNKTLRLKRIRVGPSDKNAGFGFTIAGGDDIDGLQPHVETVDPFGAAAEAGLQLGDFIISINGQVRAQCPCTRARASVFAEDTHTSAHMCSEAHSALLPPFSPLQSYAHAILQKVKAAIRQAEKTGQMALSVFRDFGGQVAKGGSVAETEAPKKSLGSTARKGSNVAKFQAVAKFAGAARRASMSGSNGATAPAFHLASPERSAELSGHQTPEPLPFDDSREASVPDSPLPAE
jgi:hypothetical protein